MRYAMERQDGVDLLVGWSPLPEGAIEPVPNWDEVMDIPWYYLKLVGVVVTEKTQEEKDTYDQAHPPSEEELMENALSYLNETDWYVTRYNDPSSGAAIPQEIIDSRFAAREIL